MIIQPAISTVVGVPRCSATPLRRTPQMSFRPRWRKRCWSSPRSMTLRRDDRQKWCRSDISAARAPFPLIMSLLVKLANPAERPKASEAEHYGPLAVRYPY
jgi:hypothetical protein